MKNIKCCSLCKHKDIDETNCRHCTTSNFGYFEPKEINDVKKKEFIANYLNKDERLKKHKLPYGFDYFNLLAEVEADAERMWKKHKLRYCTAKIKGK